MKQLLKQTVQAVLELKEVLEWYKDIVSSAKQREI